jgi:excisionase family DNA binding protein
VKIDLKKVKVSPEAEDFLKTVCERIDRTDFSEILAWRGCWSAPRPEQKLVQALWLRAFIQRFRLFWDVAAEDPRFPKLVGMTPEELLQLVGRTDLNPAEAVLEVLRVSEFQDLDAGWIFKEFEAFIRPDYRVHRFPKSNGHGAEPKQEPPATAAPPAQPANGKDYLTVLDVAKRFGISKWSVYLLCRDNRLPCLRIGKSRRFREQDISKWEERRMTGPRIIKNS